MNIKTMIPFFNLKPNKLRVEITLTLVVSLLIATSAFAQNTSENEDQFNIYGFGRTTLTWDDQDLGRSDLFVPANIKVGASKQPAFFIGAKQTRLGINYKHQAGADMLSINLEGDFHNDASDATGIFRMRHAYANYKFILVGMAWSNFFDEQVNPVVVDFEGPNSSTLSRTPQVKFSTYKSKNVFSLSLENPLENLTLNDSITALPERVPDLIAAYRINGKFGFLKIAGLLREIRYKSDEDKSLVGYGATIMTSLNVGKKDKLRFQGVLGTGVAKYVQGVSGLNYDAIVNVVNNELETLLMHGTNISYQHFWKDHLYTSITGGFLAAEKNDNLKDSDYQSSYYGSVNLFYDVLPNFSFGAEVLAGQRINVDDEKGSAVRFQMNATYKFNKPIK
jgi:DcaP outer membrane protein